MPTLQIGTLNCNRLLGKSPDEPPKTVKWLEALLALDPPLEVLCLQDLPVSAMPTIMRALPHAHFAPMTNHLIWGRREHVGIAIASLWPLDEIEVRYTWGDGVIRDLKGVDDRNERISPGEIADALVLETECRVAIAANVIRRGHTSGPLQLKCGDTFVTCPFH